ncbi:histone deacetylase [Neonectria magnoliae]|uniref:Histone deacetylase n=1 Tax=Neonectria magnoliae TaxID=2732573 RepID=A0ABR1HIN6_9HYPO
MASPARQPLPLRRQTSRNNIHDDDLTRSLKQLSLATSPARVPSSSHLSEPTTPFRTTRRQSSHSPRLPSRSPSNGRDSRSATPTLLRKASMNSLRSSNGTGSGPTPTRRASVANIMSPTAKTSPLTPPVPEEPRPTASSIANEFFKAELEAHHGEVTTRHTETIVIIHDSVYGHRFSRPRTSRSALSTIVERPERVKAAVLGVSMAYVRLGGRHCEGTYPVHPRLNVHNLPGIPFRIRKTTRKLPIMSAAVTNVHGTKWMEELKMMCEAAESKLAMGGKELQRPEMNRGTTKPPEKFHEGDLYLCAESLDAMEGALGAVCEAVDAVFGPGPQRAFVAVRPPGHHCSASYPSGFCWVNNVHVGIMHAVMNHGVTHAAIIDIDLHHGDGSQAITWEHNTRATMAAKNAAAWKKSSIGYFSMHDINSYPCEQGDEEKVKNASLCIDNAHGQTIWNVHLQSWKTEAEFWQLYEYKYVTLLGKVRNYLQNQAERFRLSNQPPKAVIFFSAGFDASEWESAGMQRHQVNVPTEFYARIAQDVIKLAAEEDLYVDGRVISVLEGGYSDRALSSGVFSHLSGLAGDQNVGQQIHTTGGLGFEMGQKIGVVPEQEETETLHRSPLDLESVHAYDPSWWASRRLDELESLVAPPPTPPGKSSISTPTYFSPTQASTAKVVEPLRVRRSLSNLGGTASRPASPPPPEVPWEVAAHELSKLLIPSDRQTDSCKVEDLNAEATRVRRDRQSLLAGVPPAPSAPAAGRPTSRMALRERRTKPPPPTVEASKDRASKARRKTVSTTPFPTDKASDVTGSQAARKVSRRLSEAPTSLSSHDNSSSTGVVASGSGTSATANPGSSTSVRAPVSGTVPAKKPRTTTTTTRKEPVPKAPRGAKKATAPATSSRPATTTAAQKGKSPAKSPGRAAQPETAGDDMDKITTGMKKIRINLITQAQKDARQRARLESEKASTASAPASATASVKGEEEVKQATAPVIQQPSITPSPEPTTSYDDGGNISPKQTAAPDPRIPTPPATISSSGLSTPFQEQDPFHTGSPDTQATLPTSSPPIPSFAIQPDGDCPDVFISYQPEGPTPVAVAQTEPLKWLPPNAPTPSANTPAATPSPVKKQHNLFQYTSGIPFAPRPQEPAPNAGVQPQTENTKPEPKP